MNANSTTKQANPQGSNTETKHTPTPWAFKEQAAALLYAANYLHGKGYVGCCSRKQAEVKLGNLCSNFEEKLEAAEAEHAALVAVAEAAEYVHGGGRINSYGELGEALANLAAVRKG